jgi:hypothetical protein
VFTRLHGGIAFADGDNDHEAATQRHTTHTRSPRASLGVPVKSHTANKHVWSVPEWIPLLAAAVVQQAVVDASDPTLPPAIRRDARRFLAGSPEYHMWGRMAEGGRS